MKLLLTICILTLICLPTFAAPLSQSVVIGGELVCVIRAEAGGMAPETRVQAINDRLPALIASECNGRPLSVSVDVDTGVISIGSKPFMTVTEADAKANSTSVRELSLQWSVRLFNALMKAAG